MSLLVFWQLNKFIYRTESCFTLKAINQIFYFLIFQSKNTYSHQFNCGFVMVQNVKQIIKQIKLQTTNILSKLHVRTTCVLYFIVEQH